MIQEAGAEAKAPASSFRDSAPLIYKPIDIGSFAEYKSTGAFVKAEHDVVASYDWGKRISSLESRLNQLVTALEQVTRRGYVEIPRHQGMSSEIEVRQELRNHALQLAALQNELNEMKREKALWG